MRERERERERERRGRKTVMREEKKKNEKKNNFLINTFVRWREKKNKINQS